MCAHKGRETFSPFERIYCAKFHRAILPLPPCLFIATGCKTIVYFIYVRRVKFSESAVVYLTVVQLPQQLKQLIRKKLASTFFAYL